MTYASIPYLVEVRLQKVHLLAILQQPGPVLNLQFLLPQHKFHIAGCVMCLAVLRIDLIVEGELQVVVDFLGVTVAGESEGSGGQVDLGGRGRYIGSANCEVDVVTFWIGGGGALGPGHCCEDNVSQPDPRSFGMGV